MAFWLFFSHFLSLLRAHCPECDCTAKSYNVIFAPKTRRHHRQNWLFSVFFFPVEMSKTKLRLRLQLFHHTTINRTRLPWRNNFPSIFFHLPKWLWDSVLTAVHPNSSCFPPSVHAGLSHQAAVSAAIVEQGLLLFLIVCRSLRLSGAPQLIKKQLCAVKGDPETSWHRVGFPWGSSSCFTVAVFDINRSERKEWEREKRNNPSLNNCPH